MPMSCSFSRCSQIVIHCERLRPFFTPFAPVVYLDHPVKFAAPLRRVFRPDGNLLWVGVRSNLPPLVEWVNRHPLPLPLDVLTNFEQPGRPPVPADFGFRSDVPIHLHNWSPEGHLKLTAGARAALDIKGDDFCSRHKPPAKAIDFIASGLPLAMNGDSSPVEYLAGLGFTVADPLDTSRWLSEDYWRETVLCGKMLRRRLTGPPIAARVRQIIADITGRTGSSCGNTPESSVRNPEAPFVPKPRPEKRRPVARSKRQPAPTTQTAPVSLSEMERYQQACQLAVEDRHEEAQALLVELQRSITDPKLAALVRNDLGALAALRDDLDGARAAFREALTLHADCAPALANLTMLDEPVPVPASLNPLRSSLEAAASAPRVKVAILSFLFNWPSTGGGIVHTVELALFLARAGYDVHHFYVCFPPWKIGEVTMPLPIPSQALTFAETDWNARAIQERFRGAVASFAPDYAILTDSWNFKPLLAEAVRGWPYLLRLQALECLCPLNNVRLLPEPEGRFRQCGLHQLARPEACVECVRQRGRFSGALHQAERDLSGVGTPAYVEKLRRAFADAEAVLVVNPLAEAMVSPFARDVHVVTAGMDPARFPWPPPRQPSPNGKKAILFAGLVDEWMKGFHVLHAACERLWRQRQDFELVVTGDPPGRVDAFTRFIGWQSQETLPQHLWDCAVLAMPTIAQEALGRTAVEAMAAGRPVVASRLGGLSFTVADGATGLLFAPGDADDLAAKLTLVLDDTALRERLGGAGRQRFEEHYAWPVIIERHYRPLLRPRASPVLSSISTT